MKKKTIALLAIAVFLLSTLAGIGAAELIQEIKAEIRRDFTVIVDGDKQVFRDVNGDRIYPILFEGTTYLPLRAIGKLMDKTVYWDEGKKEISLRTEVTDKTTTVTDADVFFDSTDNKNKEKPKTVDETNFIGEEAAKKIALDKAGLSENEVTFLKIKFERDDGIYKYDVEFRKGITEYNAEIRADDGKILEWDVDIGD